MENAAFCLQVPVGGKYLRKFWKFESALYSYVNPRWGLSFHEEFWLFCFHVWIAYIRCILKNLLDLKRALSAGQWLRLTLYDNMIQI